MAARISWLVAAFLLGTISGWLPDIGRRWFLLYPQPGIPFICSLWLYERHLAYLAFIIGPVILLVSAPYLTVGVARISKRSFWMLAVFSVLDCLYLAVAYKLGYKYQGRPITNLVILFSLLWLALLWQLYKLAMHNPGYWSALIFRTGFVAWLMIYAFPGLGEPCC